MKIKCCHPTPISDGFIATCLTFYVVQIRLFSNSLNLIGLSNILLFNCVKPLLCSGFSWFSFRLWAFWVSYVCVCFFLSNEGGRGSVLAEIGGNTKITGGVLVGSLSFISMPQWLFFLLYFYFFTSFHSLLAACFLFLLP